MDKISPAYNKAVQLIKEAILQSQLRAVKAVNQEQLSLYFGIGRYISENSREGFWGKGALDTISEQLRRELPGLRGFSVRNLKNMRTFYEEWKSLEPNSAVPTAELERIGNQMIDIRHLQFVPVKDFPIVAFLSIGFTHHTAILTKAIEETIVIHTIDHKKGKE